MDSFVTVFNAKFIKNILKPMEKFQQATIWDIAAIVKGDLTRLLVSG